MRISGIRTTYLIVVLCGVVYAFMALRGPNGIPGMIEKQRLVHEYEAGNEQLQREIEQKQQRINRLQSDPAEQEIEIRQRLKLAAPNEKIFVLDEKKK
jgi:cell division protein FtsB